MDIPLAVRIRDEAGPRLPQTVAQRRVTLAAELQEQYEATLDRVAAAMQKP